jgi:hypothetical protein
MLNLKSPFYLLASTAIVLFAGQVDRAYASPATGAIAGLADPGSQNRCHQRRRWEGHRHKDVCEFDQIEPSRGKSAF